MDRLLRNEIFLRLLAIALALLVYVTAAPPGSGSVQRIIKGVPLQYQGLPDTMAVVSEPQTVAVTVSGSGAVINALDTTRVAAAVDLSKAQTGSHSYYVMASVPAGVQLVAVSPQDASVVADTITEKRMAVQLELTGTPAPGFTQSGAGTVDPKLVTLSGASSAVADVVRTVASVSLEAANAEIIDPNVNPVPEDAESRPVPGVTVVNAPVTVTVPIGPVLPSRSITVAPQIQGQPASGYTVASVSANPATVSVLAPADVLAGLAHVSTQPIVVDGQTGSFSVAALVIQPDGATAVQPTSVQVTVTIRPQAGTP